MKRNLFWASVCILITFVIFNIAFAASSPGSESDPLITSSYLDKKIQEISAVFQAKVDQTNSNLSVLDKKVEELNKQGGGTSSGTIFAVVNLAAGKKLIGENSTEIILRSGGSKVFSPNSSGLSDITSGYDVAPGAVVAKNHLLIVPRTDGRGIQAQTSSVIMVKGNYTIQ